jgi:hypothetical protein
VALVLVLVRVSSDLTYSHSQRKILQTATEAKAVSTVEVVYTSDPSPPVVLESGLVQDVQDV